MCEKIGSDDNIALEVLKVPAETWLTDTYLPFAMYAIHDRALIGPDGLKPVNRRILWAGYKDGLGPNSEHLKASRFAAAANAYHPHASSSIEGALARMAQKFSLRVPLIDPYGSVGIVTGDTPAAARYWEARLTKAALELVKETSEGAIEIGKNFDGKLDEPITLPVRWPVDIINGTSGIAVGFASNMFSHNPDEVMDALRKILKNPDLNISQLLRIMPGPDLPTGGELFETDGIKEYYETGSGRFTIRGRYNIENLARGKVKITFFELPYQISAEQVMSKIRDLQQLGKFKEIATVKDLTDKKNGMRLVIETKAGTNHLAVLNELFKQTSLESKYSVNNTVLVDGAPTVVTMLDLLRNFISFRKQCTLNRANARIVKIDSRLKQVEAILAALLDIDKAIAIIRKSDSVEDARNGLMKAFKIDEEQSDYILSMQLRKLTRADSVALKNEKKELIDERKELNDILSKEEKLIEVVDKDLLATKKIISDPRRTIISGITAEEFKESQKAIAQAARDGNKNLPCVITRFADGRILRSDSFAYSFGDRKFGNSPIIEQLKMKTQDSLVLIGSDGIGRRIPLSFLTHGLVSTMNKAGVNLPKGVKIVGISKAIAMKSDVGVAMFTKQGRVKISKTDFPRGEEFPVFLLDKGDEIVNAIWIGKTLTSTFFSTISKAGNMLIFPASSIRASGSKAGGVVGMKLKDAKDEVIDFRWIQNVKSNDVMIITQSNKTIKMSPITEVPAKSRGGMGVVIHTFKPGETELTNAFVGEKIVAALDGIGNAINLPPAVKRNARGVDFNMKVNFGAYESIPL
jgi:DNA gyrase subunit A